MNENITEIHLTKTISSAMIMDLLENYPNLKKITCPPSVYERTSNNYIDALQQLDIDVVKKYEWGAQKKQCDYEEELLQLANEGFKATEISDILDIKLNRVYYLLRRNKTKLNTHTRKHDYDEVEALKNNDCTPQEISDKLNIPIRTVYYILNNK